MINLRDWQKKATEKALHWFGSDDENSRYFILNVAPGAGKTICAANITNKLLEHNEIERVIIIAPRSEVVNQWAEEFKKVTGRNMFKVTGADTDMESYGSDLCATWAAIKGLLGGFQQVCKQNKTLVICDEHHHAAVKAVWGKGADDAFADAKYILLLTGTPIRGDGENAIWIAHDSNGRIIHPDDGIYTLTYGEAVELEYCRPITFHRHEGLFSVDIDGEDTIEVSSSKEATGGALKRIPALKTALEFHKLACVPQYESDGVTPSFNSFQATMLDWGIKKLNDIQLRTPEAGGLVIAPNIEVAEYMAELLEKMDDEKPTIVHSRQANTENKIKAFKNNTSARWLVSVMMISEGIDIPRLRVLVYLPYARTELAFRQSMGRVVRNLSGGIGDDDSHAYVVMPADEVFNTYALKVEQEMSPEKSREKEYPTKKCPICRGECSISAKTCDFCNHEFKERPVPKKMCLKCEHLNSIVAITCENCGESLENKFTLTLKDALRMGTITRGWENTEEETQWGEDNADEILRRALESGDENAIRILRTLTPESLARFKGLFDL